MRELLIVLVCLAVQVGTRSGYLFELSLGGLLLIYHMGTPLIEDMANQGRPSHSARLLSSPEAHGTVRAVVTVRRSHDGKCGKKCEQSRDEAELAESKSS